MAQTCIQRLPSGAGMNHPSPNDIVSDDEGEELVLVAMKEIHLDSQNGNISVTNASETVTDNAQHFVLPPCPVTILSGFLGSGKTTLISYILKSPDHGKRIAVIENEFGDGLDVESMIARDGSQNNASLQELIELPNGCVCCTVKDSLVSCLENLITKRKDLDYILIECSGMANPGPIASLFWLDDALESRLRLDGIVTLVDAKHIKQQLQETEEAAQQIAFADRVLLNKTDLVESTSEVRVAIEKIHPTANIKETTYSQVPDLDWILDANCYSADRLEELERASGALHAGQHHGSNGHHHSHDHDDAACSICMTHGHRHTSDISTISLVESGTIVLIRLDRWLGSILWPNQDEQVHKSIASRVYYLSSTVTATITKMKVPSTLMRQLESIRGDTLSKPCMTCGKFVQQVMLCNGAKTRNESASLS
ncbi:hypothetical protein MPSEU_000126500 [Mayamaea pseudoterrestris]|nr:hypothetical protein MPSEU_000126500 [Mayamaea pseudoterrestris]